MFIKQKLIFLLILSIILPIPVTAESPEIYSPSFTQNEIISLPFLMGDVPVGITSATIHIHWDERQYDRGTDINTPVQPVNFVMELHLRNLGEEPAIAEIAMPVIPVFQHINLQKNRITPVIYVDDNPLELHSHIAARIETFTIGDFGYTGAENLAGDPTLYMGGLVEEILQQANMSSIPYEALNFDADVPARLYTIVPEGTYRSHSPGTFEFRFSYNPEQTMILISEDRIFRVNRESEENYEIHMSQSRRREPFEILVIGYDTLSWSINEIHHPDSTRGSLTATYSEETPREFIARAQNNLPHILQPIIPGDFLLREADSGFNVGWLHDSNQNRARGFMNITSLRQWRNLNGAVATAVHFEPGEERVLSISFAANAAFKWDEALQQSLFHHAILTQFADTWYFFDELNVVVTHPDGVLESIFSEGFETMDGYSTLVVPHPPNENILVGFWLADERQQLWRGVSAGMDSPLSEDEWTEQEANLDVEPPHPEDKLEEQRTSYFILAAVVISPPVGIAAAFAFLRKKRS